MSESPTRRLDSIDVLKGFGILFVVTNHCFARTTRKFAGSEVTDDSLLYFINRFIHFAVPLFLFVSCALLTSSLLKRYELGRYAKSRWRKNVVPYIIASLGYFGLMAGQVSAETAHGPYQFLEQLLTGKAYFHLYFTVVLIQAAVAVPIFVRFLRGRTLDWRWTLLVALALQWATFYFQRDVLQASRPGSLLIWYWVPLLLGLAVASDPGLKERLKPHRWQLLVGAIVLGVAYSIVSVWDGSGSDWINGFYALYTGILAITLWVSVDEFPRGWVRTLLAALGQISLPVFLVHPAIMHYLGGPRVTSWIGQLPGAGFWYWALVLGLSVLAARHILHFALGRYLLGESPRSVSASTAS